MEPETITVEQLCKSIQTFGNLQMAAENRDKLYRYNDALMQSLYSILDDQECDNATKMQYLDTTLDQYAAAMRELFPALIATKHTDPAAPVIKGDHNRFDEIVEVEKFNPYHDKLGRFATANRYDQFTTVTRDPNKQHWANAAIAREKDRDAKGLVFGPQIKDKSKDKPKTEQPSEKPKANLPAPSPTNTETILPEKVLKTCQSVEAKSVKLKNEKLTLVDENGQVIHEKRGSKGSVSIDDVTAKKMYQDGVTLTHNHPGEFGGALSGADIHVLTKYGLNGVRAVGKEGTYSLERKKDTPDHKAAMLNREYGYKDADTNRALRAEYNRLKKLAGRGEVTVEEANKQLQEFRAKECNKMHDWLSAHADAYGFNYVFTPSTGGVGKMFDEEVEKEEIDETPGEDALDGEFMSGDNWMLKEDDLDA